ncbi:MAG: hypothetical protein K0S08_2012 [Gammaproteobacteria bacterium]|jgi:cupin fold WbuC family metalloprotein|nr:hypothetical protein [Gammaproteobacteria bacterium]
MDSLDRAKNKSGIKIIELDYVNMMQDKASLAFNSRAPILLNADFDESPQRFVNCLCSMSYVRPHKHMLPNQWELMCWLAGEIYAIFFDDDGHVVERIEMGENAARIIEIPTGIYHTFYAKTYSSYLEVRNCSYQPVVDRVYADWAPDGNHPYQKLFAKYLGQTKIGEKVNFNLETLLELNDAS